MRLTTPEFTSYSMSGIERGIQFISRMGGALAGSGIWEEFGRRWDLGHCNEYHENNLGGGYEGGARGLWVGVCVCTYSCVYRSSQSIPLASACSLQCTLQLLLLTSYWKSTACALLDLLIPSDKERCMGVLPFITRVSHRSKFDEVGCDIHASGRRWRLQKKRKGWRLSQ